MNPIVTIYMLGGTMNAGGDGVTRTFTLELGPGYRVVMVDYPAGYGDPAYEVSLAEGEQNLTNAAVDHLPTDGPFMVGGFSQGAAAAGNVADRIARGVIKVQALYLGAALIADPLRAEGTVVLNRGPRGEHVGGYGIAGSRPIAGVLYQVAASGDPISALVKGSPLRLIADVTKMMSRDLWPWVLDLWDTAASRKLQPWWTIDHWRDWGGSIGWLNNYLYAGKHTDDYIRLGHCRTLALEIRRRQGR